MPDPLSFFRRPFDVARHPSFEPEVMRAILASWAPEAGGPQRRTVIRRAPGPAKPTAVDDVSAPRRSLDHSSSHPSAG